jgi:hypothetical protein
VTVATALGDARRGRFSRTVAAASGQAVLVVLDSCEHLISGRTDGRALRASRSHASWRPAANRCAQPGITSTRARRFPEAQAEDLLRSGAVRLFVAVARAGTSLRTGASRPS